MFQFVKYRIMALYFHVKYRILKNIEYLCMRNKLHYYG